MAGKLLGVLLGLTQVWGGVEYLPYEMTLTWNIGQDLVYFNLSIAIIRTTYIDWWGIGLKSTNGTADMSNTDFAIVTKSGLLSDRWATNNTRPELDIQLGGRNTLTYLFSKVIDSDYVTGWYRKKNTGDVLDVVLEEGATYLVLWAIGKNGADGEMAQHADGKRGIHILTFTNDYVDNSADDLQILSFSPWLFPGLCLFLAV